MQALSWVGAYWRVPLYVAVLLAVALVHRRRCDARMTRRWLRAALGMALALPVSVSLTAALKHAIGAPRPVALLGPDTVRALDMADSEFSFPSGHAASAALIAVSLWPALPRWGRVLAVVFAVSVGASRVWLGMHFPSDVLAGLAIGAAVATASGLLVRRLLAERPR